jgi:hypothetical protein
LFGIEAAARHYFHKRASQLDAREAVSHFIRNRAGKLLVSRNALRGGETTLKEPWMRGVALDRVRQSGRKQTSAPIEPRLISDWPAIDLRERLFPCAYDRLLRRRSRHA